MIRLFLLTAALGLAACTDAAAPEAENNIAAELLTDAEGDFANDSALADEAAAAEAADAAIGGNVSGNDVSAATEVR